MTYRLSVELIRLDVELSACELILILNAQVIYCQETQAECF